MDRFASVLGSYRGKPMFDLTPDRLAELLAGMADDVRPALKTLERTPPSPLRSQLAQSVMTELANERIVEERLADPPQAARKLLAATGFRTEFSEMVVVTPRDVMHVWEPGVFWPDDLSDIELVAAQTLTACGQRVTDAYRRACRGDWDAEPGELRRCQRCRPHARGLLDDDASTDLSGARWAALATFLWPVCAQWNAQSLLAGHAVPEGLADKVFIMGLCEVLADEARLRPQTTLRRVLGRNAAFVELYADLAVMPEDAVGAVTAHQWREWFLAVAAAAEDVSDVELAELARTSLLQLVKESACRRHADRSV